MPHTNQLIEEKAQIARERIKNEAFHKTETGNAIDLTLTREIIIEALSQTEQECDEKWRENTKIDENTSDGYHTFKELYEFRLLYNASLFNEWAKQGLYNVHKSQRHFEGDECFNGGWFIVVAELPTGQISNHYEMKDWDLFKCNSFVQALSKWDGHTSQDVANRLRDLLNNK